jgi:ribonuclease P protein component
MIPFANRFHGHNSLRYVYKNGQVVRSHFATLKSIHNSHRSIPRIAVVVAKKVHKGAVGRNRIRRRIYECVRRQISRLDQNVDIAIIVSASELLAMPAGELEAAVEDLFIQAGLYKSPKG